MNPTSLLNLAEFVQADPPPFTKPPLPRIDIPKIDPLPPIAPEPLPKPPVSLPWRKLLGYVPVVRFYYAGQAIAEFLDDARDMYDDAMVAEQEKTHQAKLVEGAKVYHENLAGSSDPDAEAKRQFETTCYWNCVDRSGADNGVDYYSLNVVWGGLAEKLADKGRMLRNGVLEFLGVLRNSTGLIQIPSDQYLNRMEATLGGSPFDATTLADCQMGKTFFFVTTDGKILTSLRGSHEKEGEYQACDIDFPSCLTYRCLCLWELFYGGL